MELNRSGWLPRLTIVLMLLSVIPYLAIGFFAHPIADDYGLAHEVRTRGFWEAHTHWYNNWTGRWLGMDVTSFFVMVTDISPSWYWIVPWFMFMGTFVSFYLLLYALGTRYLPKTTLLWGSLGLTLIYTARVPTIAEGYYWLMGSTCYTLGNILVIFALALVGFMLRTPSPLRRWIYTLAASLLVVAAAGTNEVLMMLMVVGFAPFVLILFVGKNSVRFHMLMIFVFACIGAAIVILAPGNALRSEHFPMQHRLMFSVVSSIRDAFGYFKHWITDSLVLSSTLLLLPIVTKASSNVQIPKERRKIWLLFPLLWLILFVLSFFPTFWAMGIHPPERTLNLIYFLFLMGWYASVIILTLILLPERKTVVLVPRYLRTAANIVFLVSLLLLPNFYTAAKDLLSQARPYYKEIRQRVETTQRSVDGNLGYVNIRPLRHRPTTLFSRNFEFRDDPDHWVNYDWERYWGLKVILEKPE